MMAINKDLLIDKKIAIGVLIAVILVFGGIIGWAILQKSKLIPEQEISPPESKSLTPEELQEALSEKTESSLEIEPLTQEEIDKALEKKTP